MAENPENAGAATRIFLLSPANLGGKRAKILLNPHALFPTAKRLMDGKASLGETFAFLSGLYFRGKLAYARTYARSAVDIPGSWVITSNRGLLDASTEVNNAFLRSLARTPIDPKDILYRKPLEESARWLRGRMPEDGEIILLGSIATDKYVGPLLEIFGGNLLFPADFVGRGDMSRGALLLRSASSREELRYAPIQDSIRKGRRAASIASRS